MCPVGSSVPQSEHIPCRSRLSILLQYYLADPENVVSTFYLDSRVFLVRSLCLVDLRVVFAVGAALYSLVHAWIRPGLISVPHWAAGVRQQPLPQRCIIFSWFAYHILLPQLARLSRVQRNQ